MDGSGVLRMRNPVTGASFSFGTPLPPGIAYQVKAGFLVDDDGSELPPVKLPDGTPARPRGNASLELWIAYAVSQGMDRDEASALTRNELRARLSEVPFDPKAAPSMEGGSDADFADAGQRGV